MPRRATVVGLIAGLVLLVSAGVTCAQTMREEALARGANLPAPFGINLSLYWQDQDYVIDTLSLGGSGIDPAVAKSLAIKNTSKEAHVTADYWVLPFLDLYAILGDVNGKTHINLSQVNIGVPLEDLDVTYHGLLYGAGLTLAGGWQKFFATLSYDYTRTKLDTETSSVRAWDIAPNIGYNLGSTALWVGARYEKPSEHHTGTFDIPGLGPVPYDVTLGGKNAWNCLAGVTQEFSRHWILTVEGGFAGRSSALANLNYRF